MEWLHQCDKYIDSQCRTLDRDTDGAVTVGLSRAIDFYDGCLLSLTGVMNQSIICGNILFIVTE